MKSRLCAVLIFVTMIFQHYQILTLAGYPLTIGAISGGALIAILMSWRATGPQFAAVTTVAVVSCLAALMTPKYLDASQFPRTFILFLFAAALTATGLRAPRTSLLLSKQVTTALLLALITIVTLSVLQMITGSHGSETFFNPFGIHQYLYEYNPHLEFNPTPRAQGFYLEPSYNAFMILTISTLLIATRRFTKVSFVFCSCGLLATQSATGFMLFAILIVFSASFNGVRSVVKITFLIAILYATVGPYLETRFSSVGTQGSSANYRLLAPLSMIQAVLNDYIFGLPLGSLPRVMASYEFANGATVGTSLDNGIYVLIFYFGWVGVIFIIAAFCFAISTAWKIRTEHVKTHGRTLPNHSLLPIWIFGSLFFSGGVMLPEFAIMTCLCLLMFNALQSGEHEERNDVDTHVEHCQRNLPRHSGDHLDAQFDYAVIRG